MDKELAKILKNLEADVKNFRMIINKRHSEINKKGLTDRVAQVEYHCSSLKIAVNNLRGNKC